MRMGCCGYAKHGITCPPRMGMHGRHYVRHNWGVIMGRVCLHTAHLIHATSAGQHVHVSCQCSGACQTQHIHHGTRYFMPLRAHHQMPLHTLTRAPRHHSPGCKCPKSSMPARTCACPCASRACIEVDCGPNLTSMANLCPPDSRNLTLHADRWCCEHRTGSEQRK